MASGRFLCFLLACIAPNLQRAATAFPKGRGGIFAAVSNEDNRGNQLLDLSQDDLLTESEDTEDAEVCSFPLDAETCEKKSRENRETATKLVRLERQFAEQDSALIKLKQAVRELRQTVAEAKASGESCSLPRCEDCAA
eukprot:TRINITY_DN44377_c0_g1_i1.p1 TRINITY_DN44377_c0_g1~~TRINITY_DN44377_c0_g1_i1.p1  ORF type:complete len:139 (-),score=25.10 TRINITY_DN44377_c0_g1_i1:85-501(-)